MKLKPIKYPIFSQRLQELVNLYSEGKKYPQGDAAKFEVARYISKSDDAFIKYLYGEVLPDEDTIKMLEDFFKADRGYLLYCNDKIETTKETLIYDIKRNFFELTLMECYKLSEFYDYYMMVSFYEWDFLYNFSLLNENGKKDLMNKIFDLNKEYQIKEQLKKLYEMNLLYEMRNYTDDAFLNKYNKFLGELKKELKKKNRKINDYIIKETLWEKLKMHVERTHVDHLDRFLEQMIHITSMDYDDWTMIICFYLYERPHTPVLNNKKLLDMVKDMVKNENYSNDSVERKKYYRG